MHVKTNYVICCVYVPILYVYVCMHICMYVFCISVLCIHVLYIYIFEMRARKARQYRHNYIV